MWFCRWDVNTWGQRYAKIPEEPLRAACLCQLNGSGGMRWGLPTGGGAPLDCVRVLYRHNSFWSSVQSVKCCSRFTELNDFLCLALSTRHLYSTLYFFRRYPNDGKHIFVLLLLTLSLRKTIRKSCVNATICCSVKDRHLTPTLNIFWTTPVISKHKRSAEKNVPDELIFATLIHIMLSFIVFWLYI